MGSRFPGEGKEFLIGVGNTFQCHESSKSYFDWLSVVQFHLFPSNETMRSDQEELKLSIHLPNVFDVTARFTIDSDKIHIDCCRLWSEQLVFDVLRQSAQH